MTSRIDLEALSSVCSSWSWRPPAPTLAASGPRLCKSSRGDAVTALQAARPSGLGVRASREGSVPLRLRVERDFYFCFLPSEPKKKLGRSQGAGCVLEREGFRFGAGRALGGTRLSALVWKSEPSLEAASTLSSRFLRAEPTRLQVRKARRRWRRERNDLWVEVDRVARTCGLGSLLVGSAGGAGFPASMHLASGRMGGVV